MERTHRRDEHSLLLGESEIEFALLLHAADHDGVARAVEASASCSATHLLVVGVVNQVSADARALEDDGLGWQIDSSTQRGSGTKHQQCLLAVGLLN